jgi:hypothetical protein
MTMGIFSLVNLSKMTNSTINQIKHLVKLITGLVNKPPNPIKLASALVNKDTYYIQSIGLTK